MRLIEEKYLIIVEIILLIGIMISNGFYAHSEKKHNDHMVLILISSSGVDNAQTWRINYMMEISNLRDNHMIGRIKRLGNRSDYADEEIFNIQRGFFNGTVSEQESYQLEYEYLVKKTDESTREYNQLSQKRKTLLENPPHCWIYSCEQASEKLESLQYALLALALGIYIWIFKKISERNKRQEA